MDKLHLDIIVANSQCIAINYDSDMIEEPVIMEVAEELDFDYTIKVYHEYVLEGGSILPENALVITHANNLSKNSYLTLIKGLVEQRPDLRFLVRMDYGQKESNFESKDVFEFYEKIISQKENDPNNPVTGFSNDLITFVSEIRCYHTDFRDYLRKYVEMRRAEVK